MTGGMQMRLFGQMVRMADGAEGGGDPTPAPGAPAAGTPPAGTPPAENTPPAAALDGTLLSPKPGEEPPKAPDAKPPETPAEEAKPLDPKDYKVELPEGLTQDDELLTSFLEGAAKGGMDNDSVNAVVASLAPKIAERLAAPQKAWTELNTGWQDEIKAQPDIGGAKLEGTVSTIQKAIDLVSVGYTDHTGKQVSAAEQALAVRQALTMTGAGNNPVLIRLFFDLAKTHVEGGVVPGNGPAAPPKTGATALYPNTPPRGA